MMDKAEYCIGGWKNTRNGIEIDLSWACYHHAILFYETLSNYKLKSVLTAYFTEPAAMIAVQVVPPALPFVVLVFVFRIPCAWSLGIG